MSERFKFNLVGADKEAFSGYDSSLDPTKALANAMVKGSKNVYKKRNGNIAPREGMKRRGPGSIADTGITSSFEWETSFGANYPLRTVAASAAGNDGKLQFESSIADGINPLWYDLKIGLSLTRQVFDTWWSDLDQKDRLVYVQGDPNMYSWSGGVAKLASVNLEHGSVSSASTTPFAGGTGYTAGDILTLTGGDGTAQVIVNSVVPITGEVFTVFGPIARGSGYSAGTVATTGGTGSGATMDITVGDTASVTKEGTETFQEVGFSSDPTNNAYFLIEINGHGYSYSSGYNSTTLRGLDISVLAEPVGSIIIQQVITTANTPTDTGSNDFLKTVNNQIYVGSYSSRIVYSSSASDTAPSQFADFTNAGSHVPGDPELMVFDQQCRGIGQTIDGKIAIFAGIDLLYIVTPNLNVTYTYTGSDGNAVFAYNAVQKVQLAAKSSAMAHEFIGSLGGNLIWLDQNNQLRELGTFTSNFVPQPAYISLPVWDEFLTEDFSGGALRTVDETVYITAPVTTHTWFYQERQILSQAGQITAEKLWQPMHEWDISRVAVIDGDVFGHSASNPMIFQIIDTGQWFDDTAEDDTPAPYKALARFGYSRAARYNYLQFDMYFIEGYILPNAELNLDVFYDYLGTEGFVQGVLQSGTVPMFSFPGPAAGKIGQDVIGTEADGGGLDLTFPKFRVIGDCDLINCFEYQPQIWSNQAGSRWEILTMGTNASVSEQEVTFIRKRIS